MLGEVYVIKRKLSRKNLSEQFLNGCAELVQFSASVKVHSVIHYGGKSTAPEHS